MPGQVPQGYGPNMMRMGQPGGMAMNQAGGMPMNQEMMKRAAANNLRNM